MSSLESFFERKMFVNIHFFLIFNKKLLTSDIIVEGIFFRTFIEQYIFFNN